MKTTRPRRLFSNLVFLAAICSTYPSATFAGETCLAPEHFGWHVLEGPMPIRYLPDDPICHIFVDLDSALRCSGYLGMLITQRPLAVEHQLEIDLSQLNIGTGELVFWEALRQGENKPTIQLKLVGGTNPELRVALQSDDRFVSTSTILSPSGAHDLTIRWTAPVDDAGTVEVWADGQQALAEYQLALETKLPDFLRVGVMSCSRGVSGLFIFDPESTTFGHF